MTDGRRGFVALSPKLDGATQIRERLTFGRCLILFHFSSNALNCSRPWAVRIGPPTTENIVRVHASMVTYGQRSDLKYRKIRPIFRTGILAGPTVVQNQKEYAKRVLFRDAHIRRYTLVIRQYRRRSKPINFFCGVFRTVRQSDFRNDARSDPADYFL